MTGPDYDEDEPEEFRPVPHPDDRLWRHPSEIAAMNAAIANTETAKLPIVKIDGLEIDGARLNTDPPKSRLAVGFMVAAGIVVVGAAALTIGVISTQGSSTDTLATQRASVAAQIETVSSASTGAAAAIEPRVGGEELLADRVHDEVAESLPRIQVVTSGGMREGSGLFVTDDGHIATSAGLIDDAEYVLAWTDDGQRWKASIIAIDDVSDVAIIHIDSSSWPAATLRTDDNLWTGQYALALDHDDDEIRLGEVTTVAGPRVGVDQSAALPGSAIIDDTGEVIAMVISDGTNSAATPAWILEQVSLDLITSGATTHTWLGLIVTNVESNGGFVVRVEQVIADSPADRAGLQAGDVIESLGDVSTPDSWALHQAIGAGEPGDQAVLTVTRNNVRSDFTATLGELPE